MSFISIHTPARGVTMVRQAADAYIEISIHTPARGVTKMVPGMYDVPGNFNPHSRKGSDNRLPPNIQQGLLFQSTLPQGE